MRPFQRRIKLLEEGRRAGAKPVIVMLERGDLDENAMHTAQLTAKIEAGCQERGLTVEQADVLVINTGISMLYGPEYKAVCERYSAENPIPETHKQAVKEALPSSEEIYAALTGWSVSGDSLT